MISIEPGFLRDFCTPQNLATWLPLVKDTLLPVFLALFDKMFCRYVAKVYTKQDHARRLSHGRWWVTRSRCLDFTNKFHDIFHRSEDVSILLGDEKCNALIVERERERERR